MIPYSMDSFAFPLHLQQVFFIKKVDNLGLKVVLCKEPRGAKIASWADNRLDLQCLNVGRDDEHPCLSPKSIAQEATLSMPILRDCRVLNREELNCALQVVKEEVDYKEEEAMDVDDGEGNEEVYY
jgi:hypothetical protein